MTGNTAIDVVIGLIFVYTLYSLLTTTVVEIITTNFQLRGRNLARAIRRMLDDTILELNKTKSKRRQPVFSEKFFKQPLIKYMASGHIRLFNKPSYLQPRNFSMALIQLLKDESKNIKSIEEQIESVLKNYNHTETGKLLSSLWENAKGDMEKFKLSIENWFDDTMERATGWFKKWMVYITFVTGFIIAGLFNADTFQIVKFLSKNPEARKQIVQLAGTITENEKLFGTVLDTTLHDRLLSDSVLIEKFNNDPALQEFAADSVNTAVITAYQTLTERLDTLYAISQESQNIMSFERKKHTWFLFDSWPNFWGCLITALALSLGAPFWFDLLNKIMRLKSSIFKPSEEPDKTNSKV